MLTAVTFKLTPKPKVTHILTLDSFDCRIIEKHIYIQSQTRIKYCKMVRDLFRFDKGSRFKMHLGAFATLCVTFFYFYKLNIIQLESVFTSRVQHGSSTVDDGNMIFKFSLYKGYALKIFVPLALDNNLHCLAMSMCGIIFCIRQLMCICVLMPRSISIEEIAIVILMCMPTVFWSFTYKIGFMQEHSVSSLQAYVFVGSIIFGSGMIVAILSEWQRKKLKVPGRLITEGLWSWSMHINYFGEFLYFLGWSIVSLNWINLWVPCTMLLGFIFWHIPGLDEYLAERYPEQFPNYAKKTKKLIPYIY